MNELNLHKSTKVSWLLVAAVMLLTIVSGYLCFQKEKYQAQNRELIIKNDSLLGANMELEKSIQMQTTKTKDSLFTIKIADQ